MSDDVAAATADQKVIYEQRCEDFRSLNGFLWQSPLIIISLTGGLWFAMASFALSDGARTILLVFAGLANLLMIGALNHAHRPDLARHRYRRPTFPHSRTADHAQAPQDDLLRDLSRVGFAPYFRTLGDKSKAPESGRRAVTRHMVAPLDSPERQISWRELMKLRQMQLRQ